jgi:hypothetical protein
VHTFVVASKLASPSMSVWSKTTSTLPLPCMPLITLDGGLALGTGWHVEQG